MPHSPLVRFTSIATRTLTLAAVVLVCGAVPASAQAPTDRPVIGVGASLGGAIPFGRKLDNSPLATIAIDACATEHVSFRLEAGAAWAQVDRRGFEHDRRPAFADLDLVLRWRRDAWQPYVALGAGFYRFTSSVKAETMRDVAIIDELRALGFDPGTGTSDVRQRDTVAGANAGAGLEYFLSRHVTAFADVRYHHVGDVKAIASFNGSLVGFAMGFRSYF